MCNGKQDVPEVTPLNVARGTGDRDEKGDSDQKIPADVNQRERNACEQWLLMCSPKEKQTYNVAYEILSTEKVLAGDLHLTTAGFPQEVTAGGKGPVLSQKDISSFLTPMSILRELSDKFITELESRILNWDQSQKVADILAQKESYFNMFLVYCKAHHKVKTIIDEACNKNKRFAKKITEFLSNPSCKNLPLKSFLLSPVQRLPKYMLLFDKYLNSLDKNDYDYDNALKAFAMAKDAVHRLNEAVRSQENEEKLIQLQSRLSSGEIILKPGRQLLKVGEMTKISDEKVKRRLFALTTDSVLCFKEHCGTLLPLYNDLLLCCDIPLQDMIVEKARNGFGIVGLNHDRLNLCTEDPDEAEQWITAIKYAIEARSNADDKSKLINLQITTKLGTEAPVWTPDSETTICQRCDAKFTFTVRKHHCRACGKVVCATCSQFESKLEYLNNALARVCGVCYEILNEGLPMPASIWKPNDFPIQKRPTQVANEDIPGKEKEIGKLYWKNKVEEEWEQCRVDLLGKKLYIYKPGDHIATCNVNLLKRQVELGEQNQLSRETRGKESLTFRLVHVKKNPIYFKADSFTANKLLSQIREAIGGA